MPDYHKILNVAKAATLIEIRNAYRNLALQFHPDLNKQTEAVDRFRTITEAYNKLCLEKSKIEVKQKKYGAFTGRIVDGNEFFVSEQNQWHQKYNKISTIVSDTKSTDLHELGFNHSNFIVDQIYKTLQVYKRIQGNLLMAPEFFIPYQDIRFSRDAWGLKLGLVVQNIRNHEYMYEYKEQLTSLGIQYPYTPSDIITAFTLYKSQHNDLLVPRDYTIPYNSTIYPKKLWALRLGKVVDGVRHRNMYSECRDAFLKLGFVFGESEEVDANLKECD